MLDFHRSQGAALTIATRQTQVETDLGVIEHVGGVVAGYREKPVLEYSASMGIYLYEPRALAALPDGPCQFPDLVLSLLEQGEQVAAFETTAGGSTSGRSSNTWRRPSCSVTDDAKPPREPNIVN